MYMEPNEYNIGLWILGSFKIRGIINQFHHAPDNVKNGNQELVTMSAGNYGIGVCWNVFSR